MPSLSEAQGRAGLAGGQRWTWHAKVAWALGLRLRLRLRPHQSSGFRV